MTNKPASKQQKVNVDVDDLRSSVLTDEFETDFGVKVASKEDVDKGTIFFFFAGERMILSIILFLAVSVISVALLFMTGTIALH